MNNEQLDKIKNITESSVRSTPHDYNWFRYNYDEEFIVSLKRPTYEPSVHFIPNRFWCYKRVSGINVVFSLHKKLARCELTKAELNLLKERSSTVVFTNSLLRT